MNNKNIFINSILLLLSLSFFNGFGQQVSYTFPPTPSTILPQYIARDYIKLQPGFSFAASTSSTFKAKIVDSITPPAVYNGTQLNENSEELNTISSPYVASIPGSASVGESGAANYVIPIEVSPGTNGLIPNLSIMYNSQTGNGIMGVGWNLTGLSSITRSGKTSYINNTKTAIQLSYDDLFQIDGARLVIKYPGTNAQYGLDGKEYLTAVNSYSKIVSYGVTGNGPTWFQVTKMDGSKIDYGNTSDSRFILGGSNTVASWMINKIEDRFGNYMLFKYKQIDNEIVIDKIEYTGNFNKPVLPYNKVQFYYETKTDKSFYYVAGVKLNQNIILDKIKTYAEENVVNEYSFDYLYDTSLKKTKIQTVKKKISNQAELSSTKILWKNKESTVNFENYDINANIPQISNRATITKIGDFNGDNLSDLIVAVGTEIVPPGSPTFYYKYNNYEIYIQNQNHTFDLGSSGSLSSDLLFSGFNIIDIDDDGIDEIEVSYGTDFEIVNDTIINANLYHYYYKVQSNFSLTQFQSLPYLSFANPTKLSQPTNNAKVDINGDGLPDFVFVYYRSGTQDIKLMFSNKWSDNSVHYNEYGFVNELSSIGNEINLLDFNGNGKMDIMYTNQNRSIIYEYNDITQEFNVLYNSNFPLTSQQRVFGDFNGDGKTDLLFRVNGQWDWSVSNSTGSTYTYPYTNTSIISTPDPFDVFSMLAVDINSDGKDDVVQYFNRLDASAGSSINLFYSDINLFNSNPISNNVSVQNYNLSLSFGNFDSDMNLDIFVKCSNLNLYGNTGIYSIVKPKSGNETNLVSSVYDGFNNSSHFEYKTLLDNSIYNKETSNTNNEIKIVQPAIFCVSSLTNNVWIPSLSTKEEYYYKGMKYHAPSNSLLGFSEIDKTQFYVNSTYHYQSIGKSISYYTNFGPFQSQILTKKESYIWNNEYVKTAEIENIYYPYPTGVLPMLCYRTVDCYLHKTISKDYINNIRKESGFLDEDNYNNIFSGNENIVEHVIERTYDGLAATTPVEEIIKDVKHRTPSYAPWYASQVETETVTRKKLVGTSSPDYIRKKKYEYSGDNLFLETSDYDNLDFNIKTQYSIPYNVFGVPLAVSTIPPSNNPYSLPTIVNSIVMDEKGRFVIQKSSQGRISTYEYEPKYGNILKMTDPNSLITTFEYDILGRNNKTKFPDGTEGTSSIDWAFGGSYPSNSLYKTTTNASGSPSVITLYDGLSRSIRSQTLNLNSETVYSETVYNNKGQLEKVSLPYIDANQKKYTTFTYDYLGRKTNETASDGSLTTIVYEPRITTVTVSGTGVASQSNITEVNCLGQKITVQDNDGAQVVYTYNSAGLPLTSGVEGLGQIMTYNLQGLRTSLNDIDAGLITTTYDAYGQVRENKTGKQNALNLNPTTTSYNNLGQIITVTQSDGNITTYDYYTTTPKIGKLKSVTGWNGIKDNYDYDALGRKNHVVEEIVENGNTKTFSELTEYDNFGRIYKQTYPDIAIKYAYQNGQLKTVSQDGGMLSVPIWNANHQDVFGNYDNYSLGFSMNPIITEKTYDINTGQLSKISTTSGSNIIQNLEYYYDKIGNMTNRKEIFSFFENQNESFIYDNLNRLNQITYNKTWSLDPPVIKNISYDYTGIIMSKTDIGNYDYGYNAGQNAVTSISSNPGNMISNQTISYTPFNKVMQISEGIISNTEKVMDFIYGPDYSRRKTVYKENGVVLKTKYFALGNYEETINATTGNVIKDYYINGGDGLAAIFRMNNGVGSWYFVHKDHLGSFDKITDVAGNVLDSYSFDAWGNRVGNYWNSPDGTTHLFDRGFTGHEHLDQFGLINMNGRLYDPKIARFLSPDPYIQNPDNTQNYNRYSYCLNNPLIYTDPSGEFIFTVATLIAAPFTGGASLAFLPAAIGADLGMWQGGSMANGTSNPFKWDYSSGKTWGYMAGGAITGGVSGYLGGAVASSGMPFANTAGIVSSSFVNSVGTSIYTGGQTDVSVSFGFGSYNFDNNSWDGIWNWNSNSSLENMGYTFGALANLSDMGKIGDMYYNVEKNDMINHAAIKDINKDPIISFGPGDSPKYNFFDEKSGGISGSQHYGKLSLGIRGTNDYDIVGRDILLKGVNTTMIKGYGKMLSYLSNKGLVPYSFLYSSCSTHVGIGLWLSGVPNLLIHPYTIQASVWLWNQGITPALIQNSYHLIR